MGFCADIFNQHVDWALKERTWNKNKAHKALYADLRLQYPDVPSALLHQFEQFLSYKAEALGKRVVFVDARYTSQKCSRCGHRSSANRKKSRFRCGSCGYTAHADINAAVNVRDNYILSLAQIETGEQGSVNAPYGSGTLGSQSQAASPCGCG
jgi:ribosomal protein S27AE